MITKYISISESALLCPGTITRITQNIFKLHCKSLKDSDKILIAFKADAILSFY